ncbi:hypothetical protein [Nostoc sp.]
MMVLMIGDWDWDWGLGIGDWGLGIGDWLFSLSRLSLLPFICKQKGDRG